MRRRTSSLLIFTGRPRPSIRTVRDQLVLPLALAAGPSEFSVQEVTSHLRTNIEVIRRFVESEIVCEGEEGQAGHGADCLSC